MSKHLARNWTELYGSCGWDSLRAPDGCELVAFRANNNKKNLMLKCRFEVFTGGLYGLQAFLLRYFLLVSAAFHIFLQPFN